MYIYPDIIKIDFLSTLDLGFFLTVDVRYVTKRQIKRQKRIYCKDFA